MKVTICIGSACHVKGAPDIIKKMQSLVAEHNMQKAIDLSGSFCMGTCMDGVCVDVNGKRFSIMPENTQVFFEKNILACIKNENTIQEVEK